MFPEGKHKSCTVLARTRVVHRGHPHRQFLAAAPLTNTIAPGHAIEVKFCALTTHRSIDEIRITQESLTYDIENQRLVLPWTIAFEPISDDSVELFFTRHRHKNYQSKAYKNSRYQSHARARSTSKRRATPASPDSFSRYSPRCKSVEEVLGGSASTEHLPTHLVDLLPAILDHGGSSPLGRGTIIR